MQEDGSYAGFDTQEFPSRSGGKAEAVKHIKKARSSWFFSPFITGAFPHHDGRHGPG
jgi:hypothetical protein